MANTLTNLKDIKVSQQALQPFLNGLMPVAGFSTNFGPDPGQKGDTIRVPLVGAPSESQDFTTDYVQGVDSDIDMIPVTINRHKFQTFHVTAREMSVTNLPVLETLMRSKAQRLAEDVLTDILSLVTEANYGTEVWDGAAEDFDYKAVLAIRQKCSEENLPKSPRQLMLDAGHYTALLADDVVAKSFNLSLSGTGVVEAEIKRIAGFNTYESNVIPANGEDLVGFASHPSAIAIAMRYLQPVSTKYDEAGAVTDPETGLTFGYLRYSDPMSNKVYITIECLYGFAVGKPTALKRLIST